MADDLYPLFLYEYDRAGRYGKPITIHGQRGLETMMMTVVRTAVKEKREIRITDRGDNLCFHAFKGCIKFNGAKHHECENCKGGK